MITQEYLKSILEYDSDTGIFRWIKDHQFIRTGEIAGTINSKGYRNIIIDGKVHKAYRLAWLYVHGKFPKNQIDHINNVRDADWISNLREATNQQNQWNRPFRGNASGYRGVYKSGNRFYAKIRVGKKHIPLGGYAKAEEASIVYEAKRKELYGEFA